MCLPASYVVPPITQDFNAQAHFQPVVHNQMTTSPPSSSSSYDSGSRLPGHGINESVRGASPRSVTTEEEELDVRENAASKDLPEELKCQFSARHCELCVVQMNSELQSTMHYNGKQHQKKVRLFMNNWIREHGGKHWKKLKKESVDDKRLYCECCDLSFTSLLHAQQHYRGRNHQRVLSGQEPLRSGYFNKSTNRWQRYPPLDSARRSFGSAKSFDSVSYSVSRRPESQGNSAANSSERQDEHDYRKGRFFCELCKIGATSQEQLDMHIQGGKHRKAERALRQIDLIMEDEESGGSLTRPADSILASVTSEGPSKRKSKKKDYSIYRTPSGKFYCHQCNLTLPCESQFIQHLDSRRHKIMTGPKKFSTMGQRQLGHAKYAPSSSTTGSTSGININC